MKFRLARTKGLVTFLNTKKFLEKTKAGKAAKLLYTLLPDACIISWTGNTFVFVKQKNTIEKKI